MVWCHENLFKEARPVVEEIYEFDPRYPSRKILAIAAAMAKRASHPLSLTLLEGRKEEEFTLPPLGEVRELAPWTLEASLRGQRVILAPPSNLRSFYHELEKADGLIQQVPAYRVLAPPASGGGQAGGAHSPEGTGGWGEKGPPPLSAEQGVIHHILLVSSCPEEAQIWAEELGVEAVYAPSLKSKVRIIEALKEQGHRVGAVGQAGEEEALRAAHVGFAWGKGVKAPIQLERPSPEVFRDIFRLYGEVEMLHRQNFLLARAFHATGMALTLSGALGLSHTMEWNNLLRCVLLINASRLSSCEGERLTPPPKRDLAFPKPQVPVQDWQERKLQDLLEELKTHPEKGLPQEEAAKRLKIYGPNALWEPPPPTF